MSNKITALPVDFDVDVEWLLPKSSIIVIGKDKYNINELVSSQYKKLISTISKIFLTLYELRVDDAAMSNESVYISRMIQIVSEDIVPILHVVTGVAEEEIDDKITAAQIVYAAKCVWEMNARNLLQQISELKDTVNNSLAEFGFVEPDESDDTIGTPLEKDPNA